MPASTRFISAKELARFLAGTDEIAVLDVREALWYGSGHISVARNAPLSLLESKADHFLARKSAPIVLCDWVNELTERAHSALTRIGFTDVRILDGGTTAWRDAGFRIFDGTYLIAHTFGVRVARRFGTPAVCAPQLMKMLESRQDIRIVDTRTLDEYRAGTLPGSVNVPLGELAHRILDLLPGPSTSVVVHCGGVTRGTLGAQTLIELGLPNRIMVLAEGVKGWVAAGAPMSAGDGPLEQTPAGRATNWLRNAVQALTAKAKVRRLTVRDLAAWRAEQGSRSLYVIDVRTQQEFERGHLPDSMWIPGGELVGMIDDHLASINSRVCLVDDGSGRAELAAYWLKALGWKEVGVLTVGADEFEKRGMSTARGGVMADSGIRGIPSLAPQALSNRLRHENGLVLDFSTSAEYERSHIEAAWWASRAHLVSSARCLPSADFYVTTSADGFAGYLACKELQTCVSKPVFALERGNAGWKERGLPMAGGLQRCLSPVDDDYLPFAIRPDDDDALIRSTCKRIIDWRATLFERMEEDPFLRFAI